MGAGFSIKAKGAKAAEIRIYEDVGESYFGGVSSETFARELDAVGSVDRIDLRLNSLGGDVFDGMAIYRRLVEHPAHITAHIDGVAASIASVIAMAGNEIIIGESASMMIHMAWGGAMGDAKAMRAMADRLDNASEQIVGIYAARTKMPKDTLRAWMGNTTWLYGKQAVDSGFATAVAENMGAAAHGGDAMWASYMNGRFNSALLTGLQSRSLPPALTAAITTAPQPNTANDDVRAQLAALNERMRARHVTPPPKTQSRGAGA
jgi:ATP-dependent protease ClpP protease subunit